MQTAVWCARGADEQEQAEREAERAPSTEDANLGRQGSQQRSLQAHCSVLHSLQLLADTVLTYFSGETAST